jgi:chitodextrinase
VHFAPIVNYVNGLAPLWAATPATPVDVPFTIALGVDVAVTSATVGPAPATLVAGVSSTLKTWTFVVKNNGTAVANNVVVHLLASAGFTATTGPQMTGAVPCTIPMTTTADCTIGDLAAGATNTITVTGYAAAGTAAGNLTISATVASTSGDPVSSNNSNSAFVVVSPDTQAPTTPTTLTATQTAGTSSFLLNWTASTDNASVIGYNVYRGGTLLASVTGTTFTDTLLNPSTTYSYTVQAIDSANNLSTVSAPKTVTTAAAFVPTTYYRISATSTLCLTTGATPPAVGSTLILGTCDTSTQYQKWAFVQSLNGITIATAGEYFVAPDVANTTNTQLSWDFTAVFNKADVVKAATTTQQWKPVAEAGGLFHFVSVNSTTKCLALPAAAAANQQLVVATCATTFPSSLQSSTITGVTP